MKPKGAKRDPTLPRFGLRFTDKLLALDAEQREWLFVAIVLEIAARRDGRTILQPLRPIQDE